jgi:hypothetical protein
MKKLLPLAALALSLALSLAAAALADDASTQKTAEEGFVDLFDGKTLDGWKVGENANIFTVHDGMIVMECPTTTHSPAHLFYAGDVSHHDFKNFDLKVDVMTYPKANSGIYFHTKFQESGFPNTGIECQVDNSHSDWRRTGSLYGIKNLTWGPEKPGRNNREETIELPKPPVTDNVWYTQEVIYVNGHVTVKLDEKTMLEYTIANPDTEHKLKGTWLPRGTFALQGHPPMRNAISKACFKNIRVKVLPD